MSLTNEECKRIVNENVNRMLNKALNVFCDEMEKHIVNSSVNAEYHNNIAETRDFRKVMNNRFSIFKSFITQNKRSADDMRLYHLSISKLMLSRASKLKSKRYDIVVKNINMIIDDTSIYYDDLKLKNTSVMSKSKLSTREQRRKHALRPSLRMPDPSFARPNF